MELTIGDLKVWNETMIGLIKELENLENFVGKAKDDSLRELLSNQFKTHRNHYVLLKVLLNGENPSDLTKPDLTVLAQHGPIGSAPTHLGLAEDANQSGDRLMAYSHFLACCRGGREFAWNLFDVTYPPLTEVLLSGVRLYASDVLTMKRWLMSHEHYLSQPASQNQIQTLQHTFA